VDTLESSRVLSGANGCSCILFLQYYCAPGKQYYLTTSGSYRQIKHHRCAVGFSALYWYVLGLYPWMRIFMGFFLAHTWIVAMCRSVLGLYFSKLFLDAFAKFRKTTVRFVMSVLHRTTRLSLDALSWNLIFEDFFPKICRRNSSFVAVWQEQRVLYTKTDVRLWYLAHLFL